MLAFNNCISGNNNGIYDKIYNDLNYYNYKEKEIETFKILLEYSADLNVKLDNENTILEESLERNLLLINKVIFDILIKENEKKRKRKRNKLLYEKIGYNKRQI